jgi:hypothetical protein
MMATINNIKSRKGTSGGYTDDGGSNKHGEKEEKTVLKQ